jgi:hypothetical protein
MVNGSRTDIVNEWLIAAAGAHLPARSNTPETQ